MNHLGYIKKKSWEIRFIGRTEQDVVIQFLSGGENKTECPASSDEWNLYPGKKTFRKNVYCLKNKYYITYQITEFLYIYKRDTSNSLFCNLIIKTGIRWERIPFICEIQPQFNSGVPNSLSIPYVLLTEKRHTKQSTELYFFLSLDDLPPPPLLIEKVISKQWHL